jgi:hypothetical protein
MKTGMETHIYILKELLKYYLKTYPSLLENTDDWRIKIFIFNYLK